MKSGVLSLALLLAVAPLANANLLVNGDLDKTYDQEILPGFFLPKPQTWINEGSRSGIPYEDEMSSEPWAGPAPTPVTTNGVASDDWAVFFKPFTGNIAFGPATGHLHQTVPAVAGRTYTFTGWAGGEANAQLGDARFGIEFLNASGTQIGGQSISLMSTLLVPNGQPFNYKQYTVQSVAPAGTASVRVRVSMIDATNNPLGGGQAYVVDDFDLTESGGGPVVAHPSSYNIITGSYFGGTVGSLAASDDDKLFILNDESGPNGLVEFIGGAAGLGGGNVSLKVEVGSTRSDLSQFLRAYNYALNTYDLKDVRNSTLADSTITVNLTSAYVNVNDTANCRVQWIPNEDLVAEDGWSETVDLVEWQKL